MIRLHRIFAVVSYASLLICIVYSSVSINALAEVPHAAATALNELIARDFALEWVATNVCFLAGLFGALVLVALRALLTWERDEGFVAAGVCAAASLLLVSIVDDQVAAGGYAADLSQLLTTFGRLIIERATSSRSPLLASGLAIGAGSLVAAMGILLDPSATEERAAASELSVDRRNARGLFTSQVDAITGSVSNADGVGPGGDEGGVTASADAYGGAAADAGDATEAADAADAAAASDAAPATDAAGAADSMDAANVANSVADAGDSGGDSSGFC